MENFQKVFMRLFRLCPAWTNLRVLHSRLAQTSFTDESVESTSQVLVMMSASLSFVVKDYDINRAYFQGTMEKLIYIWPKRASNTVPNFERRMRHCVEANTTQHCSTIQIKIWEWQCRVTLSVYWMMMGSKHIDVQIQRRRERDGRTPGVRDSNLHSDPMMKTETMSTPRLRQQDATPVWSDGRRKTEFDSAKDWRDKVQICLFGPTVDQDRLDFAEVAKHLASGPANDRALWIRICPKEAYRARFGDADWEQHFEIWSVNSEQDSGECWRNGGNWWRIIWKQCSKTNTVIRETIWIPETSSRRRCQYQEGKEARESCNNAQN